LGLSLPASVFCGDAISLTSKRLASPPVEHSRTAMPTNRSSVWLLVKSCPFVYDCCVSFPANDSIKPKEITGFCPARGNIH
jgi:hypothetical protein